MKMDRYASFFFFSKEKQLRKNYNGRSFDAGCKNAQGTNQNNILGRSSQK